MRKSILKLVAILTVGVFFTPTAAAQNNTKTCYKSTDRVYVYICADDSWLDKVFYSSNGTDFFPLLQTGFSGNSEEFHSSYLNPWGLETLDVNFKNDSFTMRGTKFSRIQMNLSRSQFHPFPPDRETEYLFSTSAGEFIYVSASKWEYSYESFRLFIGNGKVMREVKITETPERLRDGGTTTITTSEGVLYSPFRGAPTWKGKKITRENPENFKIEDSGKVVKISR